jgi:hypothetical protein
LAVEATVKLFGIADRFAVVPTGLVDFLNTNSCTMLVVCPVPSPAYKTRALAPKIYEALPVNESELCVKVPNASLDAVDPVFLTNSVAAVSRLETTLKDDSLCATDNRDIKKDCL